MHSTSVLCFDPAQTCIPLSHHIKYSTARSSLAGGLTGSGNTEDASVKAAGFSQPSTLPSTQACGAGRASEPQSSTTICPHQEGQEVLVQTAKDCSHPIHSTGWVHLKKKKEPVGSCLSPPCRLCLSLCQLIFVHDSKH